MHVGVVIQHADGVVIQHTDGVVIQHANGGSNILRKVSFIFVVYAVICWIAIKITMKICGVCVQSC
jgi:hypothetical protein